MQDRDSKTRHPGAPNLKDGALPPIIPLGPVGGGAVSTPKKEFTKKQTDDEVPLIPPNASTLTVPNYKNLTEAEIGKIKSLLGSSWEIIQNSTGDEKYSAPLYYRVKHKTNSELEFTIKGNTFTTTRNNRANFIAQLKVFFALNPPGPNSKQFPSIKAPNKEVEKLWREAFNSPEISRISGIEFVQENLAHVFGKDETFSDTKNNTADSPSLASNGMFSPSATHEPVDQKALLTNYDNALKKIKRCFEINNVSDSKYNKDTASLIQELNQIILTHQISDKPITFSSAEPTIASWNVGSGSRWVDCMERGHSIPNPTFIKGKRNNATHDARMQCCMEIIKGLQTTKNITAMALQEMPVDFNHSSLDIRLNKKNKSANITTATLGCKKPDYDSELKDDKGNDKNIDLIEIEYFLGIKYGIRRDEYEIGLVSENPRKVLVNLHLDPPHVKFAKEAKNATIKQPKKELEDYKKAHIDFITGLTQVSQKLKTEDEFTTTIVIQGDSNLTAADLKQIPDVETFAIRGTQTVDITYSSDHKIDKTHSHHAAMPLTNDAAAEQQPAPSK